MNELDKMVELPSETVFPPLAQYCKRRQEAGDRIEIQLHRPDSTLGLVSTELVIRRWEQGIEQSPRQVEWDDGLDAGLVELGIRAVDLLQEGERFALRIRAALRKVERKYGDGYLNAVLLELLDESDLCKDGEIADVRKYIHMNSPNHSRSYNECRDLIANEIGGRAVELRDKLKYGPEEIKAVMTKAIANYLDERFSVTSRRTFGLV